MKLGEGAAGRVDSATAADDYLASKDWRVDQFATFSERGRRYFAWHVARALSPAQRAPVAPHVLEIGFGNGGRIILRFPISESPFGQWYQNGDITHLTALGLSRMRQLAPRSGLRLLHWGEQLPCYFEPEPARIPGGIYRTMRRLFERLLRKMYRLDRSLDLSPNQLVVLAHASPATRR